MKFLFYSLLLCFPILSFSQQTIYDSIKVAGLERQYILYVPASYSPGTPAPLVLNFHGYTSNALEQMFYGDFRPIADTAGFLIVHPMGTRDILGNTHWNVGWGTSTVNDVEFTTDLIDSLAAQYNINQDRIYSTGMSNGGFMSYRLGCELSDRIAAIAPVAGDFNVNTASTCNPQHPMPVMEIHGTADQTVPYNGNIIFATVPSTINYWVGFNSCNSTPVMTSLPDIDQSDGCTAEHQVYASGTNGVEVEHYKIIGGGHAWPGSAFGGAGTNQDMDASKEIWRFFSNYDIHGLINTTSVSEPAHPSSITLYPNPANSMITIANESSESIPYSVSTMTGQKVMSGKTAGQKQDLDLGALPAGIYVLMIEQDSYKIIKH